MSYPISALLLPSNPLSRVVKEKSKDQDLQYFRSRNSNFCSGLCCIFMLLELCIGGKYDNINTVHKELNETLWIN